MYHYSFGIPTIPAIHREFGKLLRDAAAMRARNPRLASATEARIRRVYASFNAELQAAAVAAATSADSKIRDRLNATAVRQDSGIRPHLRDLIKSRALPPVGGISTGAVLVADERELDKTARKGGYPYWWVQEYGSQNREGLEIVGFFTGPGKRGPRRAPSSQFRSPGGEAGFPTFISGIYAGFGFPGTISRELPARHFIRDGATAAYADYAAAVKTIEANTVAALMLAVGAPRPRGARSGRRRPPGGRRP